MKYLLIPLMCFLAVTKVTLQSSFSKSRALSLCDSIFYNCVMFTASGLLFLPRLLLEGCSPDTVIFGVIAGVLSVGFQLSYMFAFSLGKPVLVTTVNNFSMFIPIAVSCLFLNEDFGIFRLVALLFAAASILMITSKGISKNSQEALSSKWIIFTLIAFLCNGGISSNQKIYANFSENFDIFSFVSITYITASVLSFITFFLVSVQKRELVKEKKKASVSAATAGVFLGIFQCVSTYSASIIDGVILYSVYNCATNILFASVRMIFFGERLSGKQILGVIFGICSILFMQ